MIIRPRPNLIQLFLVMRGSIVPRIAPQILGFALYGAACAAAVRYGGIALPTIGVAPFTVLGVALSLYLGFRNSASYDRWWEARKLWGQLIFETRNLARVVVGLSPDGEDRAPRAFLDELLAFAHLLRGQLRRVDAGDDVRRLVGERADGLLRAANPAERALRALGERLAAWKRSGALGAIEFQILDERLSGLAAVQAGCERIAGTPVPFAYTLLLHRSAYLFCLLLPIGLIPSAGWYTPVFTAFVAYSFFGLDALSEELEEPFGLQANDLALDAMCRVCEISVREALGEEPPPPPVADRYLYM
jgi:putative membrane protein